MEIVDYPVGGGVFGTWIWTLDVDRSFELEGINWRQKLLPFPEFANTGILSTEWLSLG